VTQSALSLLVKGLEKELGVRLFDRTTRLTKLSSAGADFHPMALKVLQDLDSAISGTLELQEKQRGSVRVACTLLYASALLPEILAGFRAKHPAIRVRLLDSLNG
jgi:DNA-binding transcriptional LysR family regulator